jgi:hypothetical protein
MAGARITHPHPPPSPEGRGCYAMPKKVCWTCTSDVPGMHAVGTALYNTSQYEIRGRAIGGNLTMSE